MGQPARMVAQLTCPGCWQGLSTHRSGQCSSLWGQAPSCVALSALVFPVGPACSYTSPTHTRTRTRTRTHMHAPVSWSQLTAPVAAASKPVTLISLPSSSDLALSHLPGSSPLSSIYIQQISPNTLFSHLLHPTPCLSVSWTLSCYVPNILSLWILSPHFHPSCCHRRPC